MKVRKMVESIGLIISLIALYYIYIKQNVAAEKKQDVKRVPTPPLPKRKEVNIERKKPIQPIQQHKRHEEILQSLELKRSHEIQKVKASKEIHHHLLHEITTTNSRLKTLIGKLDNKRNLMIYNEILNKPKGLL